MYGLRSSGYSGCPGKCPTSSSCPARASALGDDATDAGPPSFSTAESAAQWLTDHYDEAKNIVPLLTQAIRQSGVLIGQAHQLGQTDIENAERATMQQLQDARAKVWAVQDQIDDIVGFWKNALGLGFAWIPAAVIAVALAFAIAIYVYEQSQTQQTTHKAALDALLQQHATPDQLAQFEKNWNDANKPKDPLGSLVTLVGLGVAAVFLLPLIQQQMKKRDS